MWCGRGGCLGRRRRRTCCCGSHRINVGARSHPNWGRAGWGSGDCRRKTVAVSTRPTAGFICHRNSPNREMGPPPMSVQFLVRWEATSLLPSRPPSERQSGIPAHTQSTDFVMTPRQQCCGLAGSLQVKERHVGIVLQPPNFLSSGKASWPQYPVQPPQCYTPSLLPGGVELFNFINKADSSYAGRFTNMPHYAFVKHAAHHAFVPPSHWFLTPQGGRGLRRMGLGLHQGSGVT